MDCLEVGGSAVVESFDGWRRAGLRCVFGELFLAVFAARAFSARFFFAALLLEAILERF